MMISETELHQLKKIYLHLFKNGQFEYCSDIEDAVRELRALREHRAALVARRVRTSDGLDKTSSPWVAILGSRGCFDSHAVGCVSEIAARMAVMEDAGIDLNDCGFTYEEMKARGEASVVELGGES